ncbi:MAG: VWA domain-containing protein [Kiritimatiellae bacterium]|nr:VWA domain-containing protein [Kiritimatiellia bacterium]
MNHSRTFIIALTAILIIGSTSVSEAKQVVLDVSMANPLLLAGKKQTTYLKVGLTGFVMDDLTKRTPVNVALVIDKSGSMSGDKIRKAREAALMAVDRLNSQDIISIVAYSDSVSVLVPATKVSDRTAIRNGINKLRSGGSTALFAGVSKGAAEVRKFLDRDRVNRVILISDGLANVGPDSPGELGDLGASLAKEGISVTTIGLGNGYNEDLMSNLASRSDGNHAFAQHSTDLARIFNHEFGDITSVVAQEINIHIKCAHGIRPVKVLGRDADISGRNVQLSLNQLYSKQEKYVMLEVEVPAGHENKTQKIASIEIAYANMETRTNDKLNSNISVRFTESDRKVAEKTDKETMSDAVLQVATEVNKKAVELRDKGQIDEAQKILRGNAVYLEAQGQTLKSKKLTKYSLFNDRAAENLEKDWDGERKRMREEQSVNSKQRSW